MHAVVRSYSGKGAKELFDLIEKRKTDVEAVMRGVKGFVSLSLVRTTDGGFSVTICKDKAGIDDSVQRARAWIKEHASATGVSPPKISEGPIFIHVT
jgi:hypothetical protein